MKKKLLFAFILFAFSSFGFAQEKPTLTEKDLEKNTYYFEIADNKLVGNGAKFLAEEFKKNQYVLLGEYHNSYQISKFTKAIIPILDDSGFKTFGLEIGPVSVEILREFSKDSTKTITNLNTFNSKFYLPTKDRTYTPIPFFSNVEDAEFLAEATKRKWNLIGLDQEFFAAYLPLLERMYRNLNQKKQKDLAELYLNTTALVKTAYEVDNNSGKRRYETIAESADYGNFLDLASEKNPSNRKIADALRKTTDIYLKSVKRQYLAQNIERIEYMKQNLSESFAKSKFDLKRDKMFLKMGAVHTGRGFSPLSLFDVGNTLSELANFNGNKSLHLSLNARFYMDNGKEIDELADTKGFGYRFQALLQMSKKDKWTVIDLRPMRSDVFYARKYKLDEIIWEIFKNHDIYIMPPMDIDAKPNYQISK